MILTDADAKKLVSGMVAGALIGITVVAGTYAVAATAATVIAASFTSAESARYMRVVELAAAEAQIASEYRDARAGCDRLAKARKQLCIAKANVESKRALRSARRLAAADTSSALW